MKSSKNIKKITWKNNDTTAAYLFMRPISIRITKLIAKTNITPNQITIVAFIIKLIGSGFFLFNRYIFTFIAGILIYFSHVLDCVDGEIARLKKQSSSSGTLLDYFLDRFSDIILYSSITFSLFWLDNDNRTLFIGTFALATNFFMTDIAQKVNTLKRKENLAPSMDKYKYFHYGGSANTIIILITSILNQLLIGLIIITILSFTYTIVKFAKNYIELMNNKL